MAISKGRKIFLVIASLVVIITIIILLAITVQVPYTGYSIYTEKEPYEVCNYVEYSYADDTDLSSTCSRNTCIDRSWWSGDCLDYECTEYTFTCSLRVQNNEMEGGRFSFKAYFRTSDGSVEKQTQNRYIDPRSTETFYWTHTMSNRYDVKSCYVEDVSIPKKKKCEIHVKEVAKTKEVTKYCNYWKKLLGKCYEEKPSVVTEIVVE